MDESFLVMAEMDVATNQLIKNFPLLSFSLFNNQNEMFCFTELVHFQTSIVFGLYLVLD